MAFLNEFFTKIVYTDAFGFLFGLIIVLFAVYCFIDMLNMF